MLTFRASVICIYSLSRSELPISSLWFEFGINLQNPFKKGSCVLPIYLVMDEESNQLAKRAFKHSMVEGWLWLTKHFHLVRRTYNSLIGHVLVHKVSCIF